jgi:anti-sigma factor RsiW
MSLAWYVQVNSHLNKRPIFDIGTVFKALPSEVRTWLKSNRCPQPTVYRQAVPRPAAGSARGVRNASPEMMIGSMNSSVKEEKMTMHPTLTSTLEVLI